MMIRYRVVELSKYQENSGEEKLASKDMPNACKFRIHTKHYSTSKRVLCS